MKYAVHPEVTTSGVPIHHSELFYFPWLYALHVNDKRRLMTGA